MNFYPKWVVVFLQGTLCLADITCRDEAGEPVDWFVIYKLPKYQIQTEGSGLDYMYLDSSTGGWQMSPYLVNGSRGALGNTLSQLYAGHAYQSNNSVYALYNDAPPEARYMKEYGHSKGMLLFDRSQGFWLSHSVPLFPSFPERGYQYPSSGRINGQTALCVTYPYQQLPLIAQQMAYILPRIYNCSVPPAFLPDLALLAQLCQGSRPRMSSSRNVEHLVSSRGEKFVSFAKSERYVDDIYTGWVAQVLDADLLVESWQTQRYEMPSNCSLPRHALNIKRVRLPGAVIFRSRYDHSKWCVSWAREDQLTCLGDLNRERTQVWRGGGLICSLHPLIFRAFRQAVDWYIGC